MEKVKRKTRNPWIRIQTCIGNYTQENIRKTERINRGLFQGADDVLINPVYISHEDQPHFMDYQDYILMPCTYLWQRLLILADGSVTTCCRDYNYKYNRLGTIKDSSIKELWHSSALNALRSRHLSGRRNEFHLCAICDNYVVNKRTGQPGSECSSVFYEMNKNEANGCSNSSA